jgi:hypothetical protein
MEFIRQLHPILEVDVFAENRVAIKFYKR